jgi:alkylhydroperoxidase family enzyme
VTYKAIALVLAGMVVGAALEARFPLALERVNAQATSEFAPSIAAKYPYRGRDTRLKTPRLAPIAPENFTAEQKAAAIAGGSPDGSNANLRTALHNPELGKQWWIWLRFVYDYFGERANSADGLPQVDKELVTMRTNYLCNDDWVWGVHAPMGKKWGRSDEDIARLAKGPDAPGWSEKDRALVRAADELHYQSFISDQTWNTLSKYYNVRQMLDVIFVAGVYTTNAYFANSVGLPLQKGFGGLPPLQ